VDGVGGAALRRSVVAGLGARRRRRGRAGGVCEAAACGIARGAAAEETDGARQFFFLDGPAGIRMRRVGGVALWTWAWRASGACKRDRTDRGGVLWMSSEMSPEELG